MTSRTASAIPHQRTPAMPQVMLEGAEVLQKKLVIDLSCDAK